MKRSLLLLLALVLVVAMAGSVYAAGTDPITFGHDAVAVRVGIIAYCADVYHNAGDTGLQSNKRSIVDRDAKFNFADLADNGLLDGSTTFLGNWFLDGPWGNLGQYGAQNLADYFAYDDGIARARDIKVIDGSLLQPTATQLINNFDIIVAYTDNKCGEPIPNQIANQAAGALSNFAGAAGKKLILTGFAFSSTLGFGNGLYGAGLSPLTKGTGVAAQNAACTRADPCFVGVCPAECSPLVGDPPECFDVNGAVCTVYQPNNGTVLGSPPPADQVCRELLNNVNGPTSSSWATNLSSDPAPAGNVAAGATLCLTYDTVAQGVPFIAVNANRNIFAVNAFPPDATDIQKFWYGCIIGDILQYLSGDVNRCFLDGKDSTFCR